MDMQHTVIILLIKIIECCCHSYNDERLLINYLFSGDRYNKDVRPVLNSSMPVVINMSFYIILLSKMNVADESVCVYGMIKMSWKDELLTWNSSDYGELRDLTPSSELYWNPNIGFDACALACDGIGRRLEDKNTLERDGTITRYVYGYMGAQCTVDVRMFPFDSHYCTYRFYDTSYDTTTFIIQTQDRLLTMTYPNQEWYILGIESIIKETVLWNGKNTNYYECKFSVSRRPTYVVIHNIIPAGFVILLSVFVPFIPPDTGERLSYAITTYLATVFMTVSFYDNIPKSSLCITIISYDLIIYYAISSLCLIWSIGIVCLSRQSVEQIKLPNFILRRIQVEPLKENVYNVETECEHIHEETNQNSKCSKQADDKPDRSRIGWYETTRYLDKLFFMFTSICYLGLFVWNVVVITNDNLNRCPISE